jgi:hypothetical protein
MNDEVKPIGHTKLLIGSSHGLRHMTLQPFAQRGLDLPDMAAPRVSWGSLKRYSQHINQV